MLRLNKMTDYAVVALSKMAAARDTEAVVTAAELANLTGVQAPSIAKLLKQLAQAGIVTSQRGANGGYRLARTPEEINVAQIVRALEGPIALTACVDGASEACGVETYCPMAGNWNKVNLAIRTALESISLSEMAQPVLFPLPSGQRQTGPAPILDMEKS